MAEAEKFLALAASLLVTAAAAAVEGDLQVLLWIRAGDLAPAETDPDPAVTPRLRRMVLEGITAPEVLLDRAGGPAAVGAAVLDSPVRASIEDVRGTPVVDIEIRREEPAEGEGPPGGRWTHPAAAMLEKRFARPPPPGPAEEESVRRIRAAFGRLSAAPAPAVAAEEPPPGPAGGRRDVPAPDAKALDGALRAVRALENGAPVALVLEAVPGPAGARERDEALAQAAASLGRRGVVLALLAVDSGPSEAGGGGSRAAFFLAGKRLRGGRIIGRSLPLASVGATVLRIIGVPFPPGRPLEAIDAIEH